jgi:hypothetical protein
MKREFDRYIVLKLTDCNKHLSGQNWEELQKVRHAVRMGRIKEGKGDLTVIVVESDWPEYEPVWQAIERRVDGPTPLPVMDKEVSELADKIAKSVLSDEISEGCDISAGMFGPAFSQLVYEIAKNQKSGWIPCSVAMPHNEPGLWSKEVVALSNLGDVFKLSAMGGYWQRTQAFVDSGASSVTHWMALPDEPVSLAEPPAPVVSEDIVRKAKLFDNIRNLMGYVQNGSDTVLRIFQDDATMTYHIKAGNVSKTTWEEYDQSFEGVIEKAFKNYGDEY